MENSVIFMYENQKGGTVIFSPRADQWVENITGLSSVDSDISEAQGVGQVGATATAVAVRPKTCTITGAVRNPSARRLLLATVLPGVFGRLTMVSGGIRRYLEGIPTKTPDVQNKNGPQRFQIGFRCPYPYWRGEDTPTKLAGMIPCFQLPCSFSGRWYVSRPAENAFVELSNPGNMPSALTVQFVAKTQVTDPALYHMQSDSWIRLHTTLQPGETIAVCTQYGRKGAVKYTAGSQENVFRVLDIQSNLGMALDPGTNTFKVEASAGRDGLEVILTAPKGVWAGV